MMDPCIPVFPIFVGSGRSGTTLVQAIFSAHSELAITHESMFVPRLASHQYVIDGRFQIDRFIRDLERIPDFNRLAINEQGLRTRLAAVSPTNYSDAVRAVFAQYATQHGKVRYGDKSPGYVLHMERLAVLFPEARFVHVIRDGRDVALSYVDRSFGPSDIPEAALFWKRRVRAGRDAGRQLGPDRYKELRYEDLIESPDQKVRELCSFLDLDFEPGMLTYFEQGEDVQAATADPSAHQALRLPPTRGLRNWRDEMTVSELAVFEVLAGRTLDECGYVRGTMRRSGISIARASVGWIRWQIRRALVSGHRLSRRRFRSKRGQDARVS
jgi:hypothetical protein